MSRLGAQGVIGVTVVMRSRLIGLLVGTTMLVTACSGAATPAPTAAPTKAPVASQAAAASPTAKPKAADLAIPKPSGDLTIKIGLPSVLAFATLPIAMTVDRINSQGWKASYVEFTSTSLNTQALVQGDVQFAQAQVLDAARALQASTAGSVGWLGENNGGEFVMIAKASLADCKSLDGKRIGYQGAAAPVTVVTKNWLKACGATGQDVIISGGDNRTIAMEKDQLDATIAQMADWLLLDARAPGKFKLLDTGTTYDITGAHYWVNNAWATKNPDLAVAFFAEILKTFAMIQEDHTIVQPAIIKFIPVFTTNNPTVSLVNTYITSAAIKAWPANGGDTTKVANALTFFTGTGDLKAGLAADTLTNTTVRTKALQLVGQAK